MICLGFGDSSWGKYWIRGGRETVFSFAHLLAVWWYGHSGWLQFEVVTEEIYIVIPSYMGKCLSAHF